MVNCCSCYINTPTPALSWFPELATTVKATFPIYRCDFYFLQQKWYKSTASSPTSGRKPAVFGKWNERWLNNFYLHKFYLQSLLYTPGSRRGFRDCGFKPTFSTFKTMYQSGPRTGSSLSEDERPILSTFQDICLEFGNWCTGLCDYVSQMRGLCPGVDHPDEG